MSYLPIVAVAALALPVGRLLRGWLCTQGYRYADERHLPVRTHAWVPWVLVATAGSLTTALRGGYPFGVVLAYLAVLPALVALAAIDLDVHRLPDTITLPLVPGSLAVAAVAAAVTGDWAALGRAAAGGCVLLGLLLLLLLASRGGLGAGDVKLAPSLGALLGWLSWSAVADGVLLAFVTGGVWAGLLLLSGRAGRLDRFAFGPFLLIGALAAVLLSAGVPPSLGQ